MVDSPWLTIVGIGEDGPDGLPPASLRTLAEAEVIVGANRHLSLLPAMRAEKIAWPVPFADGLPLLMRLRCRKTVALASGNPFWFGAGRVIADALPPGEWCALPGISTFALAAARLGWPLEGTLCRAVHAAPLASLRRDLAPGARLIVLLRNGNAVPTLADWLTREGFGATHVTVLEALAGPRERVRHGKAATLAIADAAHPVAVALDVGGDGAIVPRASGWPDYLFEHDDQITKQPVRAMTLSALAPNQGEHLWDIGSGSGSVAIEWCLSGSLDMTATAIEIRPDRAERLRRNAARLGAVGLTAVEGAAPACLATLPRPNAVFIGGGLSEDLLTWLWRRLTPGVRVVANAVTLESEALLLAWRAARGGNLIRFSLAQAEPLGSLYGWRPAMPLTQWSVTR